MDGLRLRALRRFACFPSCRAALSLTLVRYCRRPVIASPDVIAAVPSVCCFLIVSASSPRHHACGSCPPRLSPRPCLSRNGEGLRAGYVMLGCSAVVACLSHAVSPPRAIWFSPRLVPVASCGLASTHVPTGACGAVRSPCLLPRLSVSIVFKMFPCQCFKTMRLFGMARLGEYRGRFCPIASPSHPRFASAVSG